MPDSSFYDDSSSALGLDHSADLKRQADREAYLESIGVKDMAAKLIAYYRERGHQKSDAEAIGVERYLSLRAGVYDRIWKYIERADPLELNEAILAAERELNADEDIIVDRGEPAPKDDYLGASVLDLMKASVTPHGGGSKSKSYKTIRQPDAPMVEQALRRQMA